MCGQAADAASSLCQSVCSSYEVYDNIKCLRVRLLFIEMHLSKMTVPPLPTPHPIHTSLHSLKLWRRLGERACSNYPWVWEAIWLQEALLQLPAAAAAAAARGAGDSLRSLGHRATRPPLARCLIYMGWEPSEASL